MTAEPSAEIGRATLGERVLAEQMRTILAQTPQGILAPAAMALISAVVVWEEVERTPLLLTLAALNRRVELIVRYR